MKPYLLLVCLWLLFVYSADAQRLIDLRYAKNNAGKYVALLDTVTGARVVSLTHAYVILGADPSSGNVKVVLSGKGAKRKALFLNGKWAYAKGVVTIVSGRAVMNVSVGDIHYISRADPIRKFRNPEFDSSTILDSVSTLKASVHNDIIIGLSPISPDNKHYLGHYVMIYDKVKRIKRINNNAAYVVFQTDPRRSGVRVIITGSSTINDAFALIGKGAGFYGHMKLRYGRPTVTVYNSQHIGGGLGCNCILPDPNEDILIDSAGTSK